MCHSIHYELGHPPRYSFWPKYTRAIKQKGCSSLETMTIELFFTADTHNSHLLHGMLQKRNKDIITFHEESNPLVY